MNILLTGAAGFIGGHFRRVLKEQGHSVVSVDRDREDHDLDIIRADVRNFFNYGFYGNFCWDLVIHCAAVVGGRQLIETPMAHAANLEIDATLFQWAERAGPGRVVYVSSVAAYPVRLQGGAHWVHMPNPDLRNPRPEYFNIPAYALRERDIRLGETADPDQLYGWAKLTGEKLASRSSVPVSVVRPFTVYGEDQDTVFPFANIAAQFREHRDPVVVWGSGNQVRDFIHVDDVVKAAITMARENVDGPVNLCTGRATSLRDLIGLFAAEAGYDPEIQTADKPEGLPYRVGNPDELHKFYVPEVSLEEGVRRALKGTT